MMLKLGGLARDHANQAGISLFPPSSFTCQTISSGW